MGRFGCFHLLKHFLLYLSNKQSYFVRFRGKNTLSSWLTWDFCASGGSSQLLTVPLVEAGLQLLTQDIEATSRMSEPLMLRPHPEGRLDKHPVMTVLNTHMYGLYREACSADIILFLARSKLVLEKAEEPEIKLPTSAESSKKQESSRKTSISALLTMPKPLTLWITINCGKFWRRWEYQTTWPAFWETCMQAKKQQLELDMEQQTGFK